MKNTGDIYTLTAATVSSHCRFSFLMWSILLGKDVTILQNLLLRSKYVTSKIATDGVYGKQTAAAVEDFQKGNAIKRCVLNSYHVIISFPCIVTPHPHLLMLNILSPFPSQVHFAPSATHPMNHCFSPFSLTYSHRSPIIPVTSQPPLFAQWTTASPAQPLTCTLF